MTLEGLMFSTTSDWLLRLLVEESVKATALAGAALISCRCLRWKSASIRHAVWLVALAGMLSSPALRYGVPGALVFPVGAAISQAVSTGGENALETTSAGRPPGPELADRPAAADPASGPVGGSADRSPTRLDPWLPNLLVAAYFTGLGLFLGRLGLGIALRPRHLGRGPAIPDASLGRLPLERPRAGIRRVPVPVRISPSVFVPMTVGLVRPCVLLPAECEQWDDAKLAAALAHEWAHVRRRDYAALLLAEVNRALFWFHPAAWLVAKRLAGLAEEACDEAAALAVGSRRGYARQLTEIASALEGRGGPLAPPALGMAIRNRLANGLAARVEAILDPRRRLAGGLSRLVAVVFLCTGCMTVGVAAAVRLHRPAEPRPDLVPVSPAAPAWKEGKPAPSTGRRHAERSTRGDRDDETPYSAAARPPGSPDRPAEVGPGAAEARPELHRATRAPRLDGPEATPQPHGSGGIEPDGTLDARLDALESTDAKSRERAVEAIGVSGDRQATPVLVRALADTNAHVRERAAWALARLRDGRAVGPLCTSLRDANGQVRQQAAAALGSIGDRRALGPLVAALRDGNAHVRQQAARSLGSLRDSRAQEPLRELLEDSNAFVRHEAARALPKLRAAR